MTDKYRKIEREYVLSDSSVNEYGFRLLTSGYQIASFQKNPIGYYMHRREEGIVLKWENVRIEDDKVVGTPVINLSNVRGAQTCDEAENGFLNAASVGHIVVLEYSTDPAQMLPGQTGPTITKWYNKECSMVDIPGNCNAITRLYDAQENELNLVDLGIHNKNLISTISQNTISELAGILLLDGAADEQIIVTEIKNLAAKTSVLELENKTLRNEKHNLQQQLDGLMLTQNRFEITAILDRALEDKKLTVSLRNQLAADYATNPEGLRTLLAVMPAYRSIAEHLNSKPQDTIEAQWQWDDFEKNDPSGKKLKELRASNPLKYKELFDNKFQPVAH